MTIEDSAKNISDILTQSCAGKKVIVWGAGYYAEMLFRYTCLLSLNIIGVIDNSKDGEMFYGREISKPSLDLLKSAEAVVIAAWKYSGEIKQELRKKYDYSGMIVICQQSDEERAFYDHLSAKQVHVPQEFSQLFKNNERFKNLHKDERVFILGTAPSIKEMDLRQLKNEHTIAVSNFYLHDDFDLINPDYYCLAQLTYTEKNTKEFFFEWIRDIFEKVDSTFFLSFSDRNIIETQPLYKVRDVNYLYYEPIGQIENYEEIDITNKIMMGASVPVDCIQLALYMGFKEIILLGVEHSELVSGTYNYFYDDRKSIVGGRDPGLKNNGILRDYGATFISHSVLWRQYKVFREMAQSCGVKILNATPAGILDVFDRVDYWNLFPTD